MPAPIRAMLLMATITNNCYTGKAAGMEADERTSSIEPIAGVKSCSLACVW